MSATGRSDVRQKDDFYVTPRWAVEAILPHLESLHRKDCGWVWEPAAGDGAILRSLVQSGVPLNRLVAIELDSARAAAVRENRLLSGIHTIERDALTYSSQHKPSLIITNPPYRLAMEFVVWALANVRPDGQVAMLLRLGWLASRKRESWLRHHMPDVYVLSRRPSFTGSGTDACDYAWMVWRGGGGTSGRISIL